MKRNRVFRIFTLAIILAMLIAIIPATPALAAERISVSPTSGEIDDYVEIDCSGFNAGEDVYFYFSSEEIDVDDDVDDLDAYERVSLEYTVESVFSTDFDVPDELTDGDDREDVVSGDYYLYAAYNDDVIVAKDEFRVIVISITISPKKGTAGTEVEIKGSGFEDRENISVKFGGSTVDISRGDDETDSSGEFTSYIDVPESTEGDHTITVTVRYDKGEAEFTVEPDINIDPDEGAVDDRVIVTGTGFAKNKDVTITFDGTEVAADETSSVGSFEIAFNVPEVAADAYDVEAEDESNNSASATFTISTDVSISPTTSVNSPGHVGTEITICGTGFKPSHEITITYTSEPVVFHIDSKDDGSFSYSFDAPPSKAGEHTITASDGTSSMSASFVMESTPPKTPLPQEPYMEGKASSKTYFDWEDVTTDAGGEPEPSLPITYELQVATDTDFTNIIREKTGLVTSEYTLTEEEKLESTSKDIPYYYWRVRAVDAASNGSVWTGAGIFTVGFAFSFPDMSGWVLYVLIGIGAILLFFIGLWLGRRGGGGEYY